MVGADAFCVAVLETSAGPAPVEETLDPTRRSQIIQPTVDRSLIKAIRKDPASYYVNVHNAEFPAGAVRGQLARWAPGP